MYWLLSYRFPYFALDYMTLLCSKNFMEKDMEESGCLQF